MKPPPTSEPAMRLARFGWRALLVYLALGIALEAMHGFKLGWYLDAGHETRRLMFTLAHAHGALLAIVDIAAALTAHTLAAAALTPRASRCLAAATVIMPAGFLLGGVVIHDGDPGLGIVLVPAGAGFLVVGVASVARALGRCRA